MIVTRPYTASRLVIKITVYITYHKISENVGFVGNWVEAKYMMTSAVSYLNSYKSLGYNLTVRT